MYKDASIVTLIDNKTHGEGEGEVSLSAGTCGMIVRRTRRPDFNHQYIVDFGPYGQWYCFHNELSGDDDEGWENVDENPRTEEPVLRFMEPTEEKKEEVVTTQVIDVERDIAKRIAELEEGKF